MTRKSYSAQRIANAYPLWADIRSSEQSLGRQFLNPIGNTMDDLLIQLEKTRDNYYLPSAVISDIDVYYMMRLPGDFIFEKLDNDHTEWLYTPPVVSGVVVTTVSGIAVTSKYGITMSPSNDVEGFWYDAIPSRISLETTISGVEAQYLQASGYLGNSPIPIVLNLGTINPPNRLTVTLEGGGSYIYRDDYNNTYVTTVQIDGQTRAGARITEDLYFVQPESLPTQHEFQEVTEVRTYCTPLNMDATIHVYSANFGLPYKPVVYSNLAVNEYAEATPFFWKIGTGIANWQLTIDLCKYDIDDPLAQIGGYVQRSPYMQFVPTDIDGNDNYVLDIAPEPYSNRLWAVNRDTLYLFHADIEMPDFSAMSARTYDAACIIEPDSNWVLPGDTAVLSYVRKRPINDIAKYRISAMYPDSTQYLVVAGALVPYFGGESSWEPAVMLVNRNIKKADELVLTQTGDHLFQLEVQYADGTSSVDLKIVTVLRKTPVAQWNLHEIIPFDNTYFWGIDFDSENKLWVTDTQNMKHQINIHYDNMIIDWGRKIIYLREPYDQVRVYET